MGARFSAPVQTGPGAHPVSCTMGSGSFPGVKSSRGVTLTPHPLLVPWSRKSRAIPLLPLWAVRPVQSLSACTRVHFYLHVTQHRIITSTFSATYENITSLASCAERTDLRQQAWIHEKIRSRSEINMNCWRRPSQN